jgi:hypothetical protein
VAVRSFKVSAAAAKVMHVLFLMIQPTRRILDGVNAHRPDVQTCAVGPCASAVDLETLPANQDATGPSLPGARFPNTAKQARGRVPDPENALLNARARSPASAPTNALQTFRVTMIEDPPAPGLTARTVADATEKTQKKMLSRNLKKNIPYVFPTKKKQNSQIFSLWLHVGSMG